MENNESLEHAKGIAKGLFGIASNVAKSVLDNAKKVTDDVNTNMEIKKIKDKILEHKYNIGKYIYDHELEVDDGVVISNINSIDRLVEEIEKLEGKKNG